MKELTCLLVCVIMFFIYMNYIRKSIHLSLVKSTVDGNEYYVRNLDDKVEAANKLANLSQSLLRLLESVKDNNKKGIDRLIKRFDPKNITENIPGSLYVAYSVNKGDELSICIREKKTEKFLDQNTVIFVAIHEIAHIMTESTGHTEEFWNNMKYLLKEGIKTGIYEEIDYAKYPTDYCGMEINNTPLNLKNE